MIYEEEIEYRKAIMNKAYKGIKITPEERTWLLSHSLYNPLLGYPYYNVVIEKLKPKTWYTITVAIESISYNKKIYPIIAVATGKGKIITDFPIYDFYKKEKKSGTPIKMLSLEMKQNEEEKIKFISDLGCLSVEYEGEFFNRSVNRDMSESSGDSTANFAMIREVISDHKVRYNCKSPEDDDNSFGAMIFTVEWTEIEE